MDDASCFHDIRLELKTSVNDMNVTVVSTVTGCDVTTVQQHYKRSTSGSGPLHFYWGKIGRHLLHVATSISWPQQHGNSGPQPRTLHCWATSRCAPVSEVDCDRSTERSTRVSISCRKVAYKLVGFLAKGCAKWFGKRACSFVVKVWFGVVLVGLRVVVPHGKRVSVSGDHVVAINDRLPSSPWSGSMLLNCGANTKSSKFEW